MNSSPPRITRRLDVSDPREIEAYERAFHAAFRAATHNRLVRWLWDWDDAASRLRTRVPYEHQAIWVLSTTRDVVTAGIGVNVRREQLQAAAFGFRVPDASGPDPASRCYCEILTLFVIGRESVRTRFGLWREVFEDLRGLGFTHALATTAPKVLPLYRFIGGRVLAETCVRGEARVFLEFDLSRTCRRGRREPAMTDGSGGGPVSGEAASCRPAEGVRIPRNQP